MPEVQTEVRTKKDVTAAFNEADGYFEEAAKELNRHPPLDAANYEHTYTIQAHEQAATILAEIFDAQSTHRTTSTIAGGGSGAAVFVVTSSATAPFLGPFCVVAGAIAAALTGKGAAEISRSLTFDQLYDKYGMNLVEKIRRYPGIARDGNVYRIKRDFSPVSMQGPSHS